MNISAFIVLTAALSTVACKPRTDQSGVASSPNASPAAGATTTRNFGPNNTYQSTLTELSPRLSMEEVTYNPPLSLQANNALVLPRMEANESILVVDADTNSYQSDRDLKFSAAYVGSSVGETEKRSDFYTLSTLKVKPEQLPLLGQKAFIGDVYGFARQPKSVTKARFYYLKFTDVETERVYAVNRKFAHVEDAQKQADRLLTVPLDPNRGVDQIAIFWTADSRDKMIVNGKVVLNHENDPSFWDAFFANALIMGPQGNFEVPDKKFVDRKESDNWHDLPEAKAKGDKLSVRFRHEAPSDRNLKKIFDSRFNNAYPQGPFAPPPAQSSWNTNVEVYDITVRYHLPQTLPQGMVVQEFSPNDRIGPNRSADYKITGGPGRNHIVRVDIRWGDRKPKGPNGSYVPGGAVAGLVINGAPIGEDRIVALRETETWTNIYGAHPAPRGDHTLRINNKYDDLNIEWIKVYLVD